MDSGRARTRLFVGDDLAPGESVEVGRAQAHYLANVLRLKPGATVALFNGRDGEWVASLAEALRGRVVLAIDSQTRPQVAEPDLWLLFAPIKRAPIDLVAAKATELGVSAIHSVRTRRTVIGRVNLERLRANAIEAAQQCGRLSVPEIRAPARLEDVLADWPAGRRLLVLDESGSGAPIAAALGGTGEGSWAVLVGPEGGFERSELDDLRNMPFVTAIGMGPRILRSETAALAALACWQALLGDWGKAPPVPSPGA